MARGAVPESITRRRRGAAVAFYPSHEGLHPGQSRGKADKLIGARKLEDAAANRIVDERSAAIERAVVMAVGIGGITPQRVVGRPTGARMRWQQCRQNGALPV